MELRDLRYFVAVAEASGIRRAALHLGVRQSMVSRRVRDLEDFLGVSLFERHRGGVRLTYAGVRFLGDLRFALSYLDAAVRSVVAAGTVGEGCLKIGVVASFSTSFLNRLLRQFMSGYPNVELDIAEGDPAEHIGTIRSRALDLTFVTGTQTYHGCDVEVLWSEPIMTAFPAAHPRAAGAVVCLRDLSEERFIVSRAAPGPEIHDFIVQRLSALGSSPRVDSFGVGREALMSMVGLGFGVSFVSGAEAGVTYPGVTFVPLVGETLPFSAVWSPDNDNPALRRFLSAARVMARKAQANGALS